MDQIHETTNGKPKGAATLSTYTPATIALIEADATARYGLPMKVVFAPKPKEGPSTPTKPSKAKPTKPLTKTVPSKPPPTKAPAKALVYDQFKAKVMANIRKLGDRATAERIIADLGPDRSKVWGRWRDRLLAEGQVVTEGEKRSMTYSLKE